MFSIQVCLAEVDISGLSALDERRRLGLQDGSRLILTSSSSQSGAVSAGAKVTEGFARANFARDSVDETEHISIDLLCPGDLVPCHRLLKENTITFTFAPDISPARVQELFLSARRAVSSSE